MLSDQEIKNICCKSKYFTSLLSIQNLYLFIFNMDKNWEPTDSIKSCVFLIILPFNVGKNMTDSQCPWVNWLLNVKYRNLRKKINKLFSDCLAKMEPKRFRSDVKSGLDFWDTIWSNILKMSQLNRDLGFQFEIFKTFLLNFALC